MSPTVMPSRPRTLRARLTVWYVSILAVLLLVYAATVFVFQYAVLQRQIAHDEIQDVITVEGLLYFDAAGALQLHEDYFSRPQSRLLIDRYMEVRDLQDRVLYRSATLGSGHLGGPLRKAEGDQTFDERIVRLEDGSHVFMVSHIHAIGSRSMVIRLAYSIAPLRTRMLQFLLLLLIAIPLALLVAALAGQAIAARALRPIDAMSQRAAGISASNLHDRLAIHNPDDELGRMAAVFNALLDRLEEAFVQLRRFTSDAAHELRTPLASIRTIGEVALTEDYDAERSKEALADILEQSSRLTQTIDSLLLLARAETATGIDVNAPVPLNEVLNEVAALLQPMLDETLIQMRISCQDAGAVLGDRTLLRTAFVNVLHNAWKFSPREGSIRVNCAPAHEGFVRVVIQDDGPGIPAPDAELVFDRFRTGETPPDGRPAGNGLGLAITKLIVERCGGTIYFEKSAFGARCVMQLRMGLRTDTSSIQ